MKSFIALLAIVALTTSCTKQDDHNINPQVNCEPVEIPTYGHASQISFVLSPTETYTYNMTFNNDHDYAIRFNVSFPDMPENMQASIQENDFSITDTKNYFNRVTLTTTGAKPGKYEVPIVVTTDKGGPTTTTLSITVVDEAADTHLVAKEQ